MTTPTKLPTKTKVQLLRHHIIHQTLIRLKANQQGDNGTALYAEIEREIAVKAINRIQHNQEQS